jgi:hypothetical protein
MKEAGDRKSHPPLLKLPPSPKLWRTRKSEDREVGDGDRRSAPSTGSGAGGRKSEDRKSRTTKGRVMRGRERKLQRYLPWTLNIQHRTSNVESLRTRNQFINDCRLKIGDSNRDKKLESGRLKAWIPGYGSAKKKQY